jgi:hypothetical protein
MITLNRSPRFKEFFCVKDPLTIPFRYAGLVNNRRDVFEMHLSAVAPLTYESLHEITETVKNKYRIIPEISMVVSAWNIINLSGVSFDFCYKTFHEFTRTNKLYDIKLDRTVEEIYSRLFSTDLFSPNRECIFAILKTFYSKITNKELEMLKDNKQDVSVEYKNLANYVWLMEAMNYYKDSGVMLKLLNTDNFFSSNVLIARNSPSHVAIFDGVSWVSKEFKETNTREFVYDKITLKHLKLDNKTLFQINDSTFHMRDDILAHVLLREGDQVVEPNQVTPNKAYFCDVRYPGMSDSCTEGLEIEAVTVYGCTFKDSIFSIKDGKATTQVIINDKDFRFKIKTLDRLLPSCYVHNTEQISIDELPWLDK